MSNSTNTILQGLSHLTDNASVGKAKTMEQPEILEDAPQLSMAAVFANCLPRKDDLNLTPVS